MRSRFTRLCEFSFQVSSGARREDFLTFAFQPSNYICDIEDGVNYGREKDNGLLNCFHWVVKKELIFQLRHLWIEPWVEFVKSIRTQWELQKCPVNEGQRMTQETTLAKQTHEKVMIFFFSIRGIISSDHSFQTSCNIDVSLWMT